MGAFSVLFSIEVDHEYFSDGLLTGLSWEPCEQTVRLLGRENLLLKPVRNGIVVIRGPAPDPGFLPEDGDCLQFRVRVTDPHFGNYTEPPSRSRDAVLYFDNLHTVAGKDGGERLHAGETVSAENLQPLDSEQFNTVLRARDRKLVPDFVVRIDPGQVARAPGGGQVPTLYRIRFGSRATLWKYCLLGSMNDERFFVLDPDGEQTFSLQDRTELPAGRSARVFVSERSIPLKQRSVCRFQLREKTGNGGRVVIKRLPVASPDQLYREEINGKNTVVSEIFVNY